ncbi:uncharacterized protein LOC112184316 [Rosa chinensis]|uniref:uncharacterized protein LOC112184316 n=1 Tax=Rosa chinensis TaxID=74649 RepID=UPI000D088699|nr:uncharacterized protein LOC112184316 [Rosa chinensis]
MTKAQKEGSWLTEVTGVWPAFTSDLERGSVGGSDKIVWQLASVRGRVRKRRRRTGLEDATVVDELTVPKSYWAGIKRRVPKPWLPPPAGWLKANTDGAFDPHSKRQSLGVLFKDHDGVVVAGRCWFIPRASSAEEMEALAGCMACRLATDHGLFPVSFESDCLTLVNATKDSGGNLSILGRIIDDIVASLQVLLGASFSHVYRESNTAAYKLANLALHSRLDVSWVGSIPPSIKEFVLSNCNC